jgi:hypothetical protein
VCSSFEPAETEPSAAIVARQANIREDFVHAFFQVEVR